MTILEAIAHLLKHTTAVAQIVGDRIYPEVLPQNPTYPAIVYHVIATDPDHTQDGPSGYTRKLVQFDYVARTAAEVEAISRAVRIAMDGLKGLIGEMPLDDDDPDQVPVFACFRSGERSDYDDEFKIHLRIADFEVHFDEEH